ncbi:hypothetical protein RB195_021001 [Necator americanus]|uniref:Uncharacterized protein n=1 Tax=Necator americanus TaxID=51031 RepID=A0ABR1CLN0_NECAM
MICSVVNTFPVNHHASSEFASVKIIFVCSLSCIMQNITSPPFDSDARYVPVVETAEDYQNSKLREVHARCCESRIRFTTSPSTLARAVAQSALNG